MRRRFLARILAAGVPWLASTGLAAAAVLVTPWSAVAATPAPPGGHHVQKAHHTSKKQPDPVITIGPCTFNLAGTTLTLTADCTTMATIPVPDGDTLDGAGHTIFARDPAGSLFSGAVVGNAGPVMSLKNLTIDGEFGPPPAHGHCPENPPLWGVSYANASGSVTNVHIVGMTRHGTCGIGFGIRIAAEDSAGHQAITITGCSMSDFQRGGLLAAGNATVNVSHSTIGPPDLKVPNPGGIAQNTVQYGSVAPFSGTGGVFTGNKVIGAAFGTERSLSTGILVWDAANLTISRNTFGGAGTDIGVSVHVSRDIKIEYNHIARTAAPPGFGDHFGFAVAADGASGAQTTLVCNTFSGWRLDLDDVDQRPCVVSLHVAKTAAPDPGVAGQPIVFTVRVGNGGPDDALGVTVRDAFAASLPGFTWACSASGPPSRCYSASGTGPLGGHPVDVAAGGTVTFTLTGILPEDISGQVVNDVSVIPGPGDTDSGCTRDCSASVTVDVVPALPVTGPDLLPEAAGGTGLVAVGGLILLAAWRRKPAGRSRA